MVSRRWLLLTYQLPSRPSNGRVRTWRRLQEIGAAQTGTSAYVLPDTDECRAEFHWLQREIAALGGRAVVFSAEPTDLRDAPRLIALFKQSREADYRALVARARQLGAGRDRRGSARPGAARRRAIRGLRDRFEAVARIDFFHARGRAAAQKVLAGLDGWPQQTAHRAADGSHLARADFRHRRWVTRPRPGIDRLASAWLIRRFVDPWATFAFMHQPSSGDVPFDIPEMGFGHRDGMCTFETLVDAFAVRDPAALRLGRIVHDLDLNDARYRLPEAPAIGRVIEGLREIYADDHALLEQGIAFFESFAQSQQFGEVNP